MLVLLNFENTLKTGFYVENLKFTLWVGYIVRWVSAIYLQKCKEIYGRPFYVYWVINNTFPKGAPKFIQGNPFLWANLGSQGSWGTPAIS